MARRTAQSNDFCRVIETCANCFNVSDHDFDFDGRPAPLALAFISPNVNFQSVVTTLQSLAGCTPVIAVSTAGELRGGQTDNLYLPTRSGWSTIVLQIFSPALLANVSIHSIALPNQDIRLGAPSLTPEQRILNIVGALDEIELPFSLDARDTLALTYIDGLSFCENYLMQAVYRSSRFPCLFVGGSAGGVPDTEHTWLFDGRRVLENHAVITFIKLASGKRYAPFKSQNFRKTKRSFPIFEADPDRRTVNTVVEMATGEILPFTEALARTLSCQRGEIAERMQGLTFGIELEGELFARTAAAFDTEKGAISFFCDVNPGDELWLLEPTDFVKQTREDFEIFMKGKPQPIAGLLNDCIHRRLYNHDNLSRIGNHWAFPVAGFSTFGELLGININHSLAAIFFFDVRDSVFADPYIDTFTLSYARYCNYFTRCHLKRIEMLNFLRSSLMRQLLEYFDTQATLRTDPDQQATTAGIRGTLKAIHHSIRADSKANDITGDIASLMSEARRINKTIRHLAYHDPLTALPNRYLLQDRIRQSVALANRDHQILGVMFLDRFKAVNDRLGHDMGDRLLQEVARRLTNAIRCSDTLARLGGDEFVVLLVDLQSNIDVICVARRILASIAQPFMLGGETVQIGVTIGVSLFPQDGADSESLLRNADAAMYAGKAAGKNCYRFYDRAMNERASERFQFENEIRRAIDQSEFELHYQPKIDLESGRAIECEALVRWRHPDRGLLYPVAFIPLCEDIGLIKVLDDCVLNMACKQLSLWRQAGLAPLRVAVNLSSRHLQEQTLPEKIFDLLHHWQLPATCLEIELTETTIMADPDLAIRILTALREMGISLAVDDFGTGYSSLSYLRKLPLDTIKIDRTFIAQIEDSEADAEIVRGIISMCMQLHLNTVAEGVETGEQAALLKTFGCTLAQGYWYGRPLPADAFSAWLKQQADGMKAREKR